MRDDMPVYITVEEAASYVGIGKNLLWEYVRSDDPPPYLLVGKRDIRLQRAALATYFERKQEVVCR